MQASTEDSVELVRGILGPALVIWAALGMVAEASDHVECHITRAADEEENCSVLSDVDSTSTDELSASLTARARAHYDAGELGQAIADIEQAIGLSPEDPALRLLRANIAYAQRDYAGAIEFYSQAIENDPFMAAAYAGRGGARTYEGDLAGAFADFNEAITSGYATAWVYNGRGNAHRAAEQLDRAYEDYLRAAALDPAKVDAWLNIGDIRLINGDDEGARKAYQRAVDLNTQDRSDAMAGATGLGEALARLGRFEEAFEAYERGFAWANREEIIAGQEYLKEHGYFDSANDGVFGAAMRAAVKQCIADPNC